MVFFGSTTAHAYDHVDAALEFVFNASVNEIASGSNPCTLNWDTYEGYLKAACFFTLSLRRAHGYSEGDIYNLWANVLPPTEATTSPSSGDYFSIIDGSPYVGEPDPPAERESHFRRIGRAVDIARGDVIAINTTSTYSGHLLMVREAPTDISSLNIQPVYAGTKQYRVAIVDATSTAHGCKVEHPDSRWVGTCTSGYTDAGAGTGFIRLYTDASTGALLGHTWSLASSLSTYMSPSTRPYRVGRLVNLPPPAPPPPPPPPPPE